jgi:hypothetical protein
MKPFAQTSVSPKTKTKTREGRKDNGGGDEFN